MSEQLPEKPVSPGGAKPPAVVVLIVVGEIQVVVGPQALAHHQVMRLVARRRVFPVRRQRPADQEDDGGCEPPASDHVGSMSSEAPPQTAEKREAGVASPR